MHFKLHSGLRRKHATQSINLVLTLITLTFIPNSHPHLSFIMLTLWLSFSLTSSLYIVTLLESSDFFTPQTLIITIHQQVTHPHSPLKLTCTLEVHNLPQTLCHSPTSLSLLIHITHQSPSPSHLPLKHGCTHAACTPHLHP